MRKSRNSEDDTKSKSKNQIFYVEKILKHREEAGKTFYFVKWFDFGEEFNSWEPSENFNSKVLEKYEQEHQQQKSLIEEEQKMQSESSQSQSLTAIEQSSSSNNNGSAPRMSTRQRKPTYKQSLIEQSQSEHHLNNKKRRSTPESSSSQNFNTFADDSFYEMASKKKGRRGRPPRQSMPNLQEQQSQESNASSSASSLTDDASFPNGHQQELKMNRHKLDDFPILHEMDRIDEKDESPVPESSSSKANKAEEEDEYPFELHPYNGLIGEEINYDRIGRLTKEMDEALEKIDGFLIIEEPNKYDLSRLILIAKRPLGMVAYLRIEHRLSKHFLFECVPLELFIAKYPDDVLEYMEEQIKTDMLEERRRLARENKMQNGHENGMNGHKMNGHKSNGFATKNN